jgi:pimeloyl-ACP methyl ester carboxylesterase
MSNPPSFDPQRLIFLHGLESSSQGRKVQTFRRYFPEITVPDFTGDLSQRMAKLLPILAKQDNWTIIGSSFGGLMGALFTCQHPGQVRKLVLMAPALMLPEFAGKLPAPVDVPTVVYHGTRDTVVPLGVTRQLAEQVFRNLEYHVVDDDHGLYNVTEQIDWGELLRN